MPFYEYRCDSCGHELEAMQKISDAPLSDCPACAAPALVKLISAAGFRLKGGGWYETDFKGGAKKNVAEKASSESSGHSCSSGGCCACS
ncbi:MAG: zinc ribbon domain-containing protein [Gammaproteobacteria bacterium]|nr:zinc ribbon domain-containing protein [Gammaproteobacteria bacterium]MCB1923223.1 zinc ribbon domain-containing protein [Gammaproteobacteria bacterium]